MLSFCCFCTRDFRAPLTRLGDGSLLLKELYPRSQPSTPCQPSQSGLLAWFGNTYLACSPGNFCGFFLRICLGILRWKPGGTSSEFLVVYISRETKHKIPRKLGEIWEQNSAQISRHRLLPVEGFPAQWKWSPPSPGLVVQKAVSTPVKQSTKQWYPRGAKEVRRGTSSMHFHCPAPQSSSHIGHGISG